MKTSEKGLELIKEFEGCKLKAYKPVAGETYWTIGWGHYGPDVTKGMVITQEQADQFLKEDLANFEKTVENICLYLNLNQNEFDALVSFTYNCGSGNLLQLTKNKSRTKAQIAEHIEAYNKGAGGVVLAGLVRRRKAEKELFLTPVSENQEKLDYLGVTKFWEKGYKGKGIIIASREGNTTTHGNMVYKVLQEICPEAEIVLSVDYKKGVDADIYTTSEFFASDKYDSNRKKAKGLWFNDVFLCCAVGNYGEDTSTNLSKDGWWTSVGACDLTNGEPKKMYYSSIGEQLDFMSFTNMTTDIGKFTGTSCATPVFAAMCGLVQSFFIKKTDRKLNNLQLLKFIKDHTIDLEDDGRDNRTGYGIFVLPDPDDIDIGLYEEEIEVRYNTLDELPEYAQPTIEKLLDKEYLKGKIGGLDLSEDMVRMLVILDRAGVFGVNEPNPQHDEVILPPFEK